MIGLKTFSEGLTKIREGLEMMEVKGRQNAALLVYCHDKCSEMINEIEEVINRLTQDRAEMKEGETDEQDSGVPGQD